MRSAPRSSARGRSVLVVAGEASGDRIAALAARELTARGARCWGLGGDACKAAGVEVLADVSATGAMGLSDALRRGPAIARSLGRLARRAASDRPDAALLVNFTEVNTYVGRALRGGGTRVVWCVAPQAWAWRAGRLRTLGRSLDKLAVILPFEEELWRRAGVDATYVGHPSLEGLGAMSALERGLARALSRRRLGLGPDDDRAALAVLPGSRRGEVARLARPLCEAASMLVREGSAAQARVLAAPWLDAGSRSIVANEAARWGLSLAEPSAEEGASPLLRAFDVSLCASGTASLEAALAGAPPVVVYRMDALSFAVARRMVTTPYIALPNIVLGRRAVPELVQSEVTAARIAQAARELLGARGDGGAGGGEAGGVEKARAFAGELASELAAALHLREERGAREARECRGGLDAPSPTSCLERGATFGSRVADLVLGVDPRGAREAGGVERESRRRSAEEKEAEVIERNRHSPPRGYFETFASTKDAEASGRGQVAAALADEPQSSSAGGGVTR